MNHLRLGLEAGPVVQAEHGKAALAPLLRLAVARLLQVDVAYKTTLLLTG